ncbi:MAG TPA: DUF5752 family protein [Candidatus Polarisedimenticolaceae bacterium]
MTALASVRARAPFRFVDYEGLVVVTGLRAANLQELADQLRRVPGEVVHHHLYRSFLAHRYGSWDYPNDFATWVAEALGDRALAEKLSAIEPFKRTDLEQARAVVLEVVEEHLDGLAGVPWARRGFEFHFASGHYLELPTDREAWSVAELHEGIAHAPLSSLYFHFHEAKLRGGADDYSRWLEAEFGASAEVSRLRRIDFYFFSLEELRHRILRILEGHPEEGDA